MGKCEFVDEKFSSSAVVKGTTAFAEKANAPGIDTGVYLPPSHSFGRSKINAVLWLHGYYVQDARDGMHPFNSDMDMKLRQSVLGTGKDVVLIAPWLGLKSSSTSGSLGLGSLGQGAGIEGFLNQVLDGLARFQKTMTSAAADSLELGNLVLAGHSAGGAQMREAAKHLGKYGANLKECWGFDCFYDGEWPSWVRGNAAQDKYFYFAHGSGGGGSYAFELMKQVYGSPKKPMPAASRPPSTYLAPAVDRVFTGNDDVAFQSVADVDDWAPAGPNLYTDIRKASDVFLDDLDQSRYWNKVLPKLTGHFQVVRDLLGPRIKQSSAL